MLNKLVQPCIINLLIYQTNLIKETQNMSDRNKKFRSHCNIDVLLDPETSAVQVEVRYKPEMFSRPLSLTRNRYFFSDIKEELERQGIITDPNAHSDVGVLDHTSSRTEKHSLSVLLQAPKVKAATKKKETASTVAPSVPVANKPTKTTNK